MALTIDGSDPSGDLGDLLDAKLNIAGGKILQIVRATDTTNRQTSSTSYVDVTGMSVTITPQKSTSAVYVFAAFRSRVSGASNATLYFQIATSGNTALSGAEDNRFSIGGSTDCGTPVVLIGYAVPGVTTAVTYKLRFYANSELLSAEIANNLNTGQIIAIEVSA